MLKGTKERKKLTNEPTRNMFVSFIYSSYNCWRTMRLLLSPRTGQLELRPCILHHFTLKVAIALLSSVQFAWMFSFFDVYFLFYLLLSLSIGVSLRHTWSHVVQRILNWYYLCIVSVIIVYTDNSQWLYAFSHIKAEHITR